MTFQFVGSLSPMLAGLNEDRLQGNGTGITFHIGPETFLAHRIVLREPFLIQTGILAQNLTVFRINDLLVKPEVMKLLLTYLYTGKITLTLENAHALCDAAHFFKADELVDACEKYLSGKISAENAIELTILADRLRLNNLLDRCAEPFRRDLPLLDDARLMQLTKDSVERLACQLAKRPIGREAATELINKWIQHEPASRTVFEASLRESLNPFLVRPGTTDYLFCMGGRRAENTPFLASVSRFDSYSEQWQTVYPMPNGDEFIPGAVVGRNIYICGVWDNEESSFGMYDSLTDSWQELEPLPFQPLDTRFSMASTRDRIYVTCFLPRDVERIEEARNVAFEFNSQNEEWRPIAKPLVYRTDHQMVGLGGYIYAIGGAIGGLPLDHYGDQTVERYNPDEDNWTMVASMNYQHTNYTVVAHDDRIYVYSLRGFEVYDPQRDAWQKLTKVDLSPWDDDHCATLASVNGQLLLVGGRKRMWNYGQNPYSAAVIYSYDEYTDQWSRHADMDAARGEHSSFVVNF